MTEVMYCYIVTVYYTVYIRLRNHIKTQITGLSELQQWENAITVLFVFFYVYNFKTTPQQLFREWGPRDFILKQLQRLLSLLKCATWIVKTTVRYSWLYMFWSFGLTLMEKGTDIQVIRSLIFLISICKCRFSVMSYLRKNVLYFCNHFALAHIFLEIQVDVQNKWRLVKLWALFLSVLFFFLIGRIFHFMSFYHSMLEIIFMLYKL